MAPLTTMKLPAQKTMMTRTPSSAKWRSAAVTAGLPESATPADSAGVAPGSET